MTMEAARMPELAAAVGEFEPYLTKREVAAAPAVVAT